MSLIELPNAMWVTARDITAIIPRHKESTPNGHFAPKSHYWVDVVVTGIGKLSLPCESNEKALELTRQLADAQRKATTNG